MIETRELEARALDLAAGLERPDVAAEHLAGLQESGELVELEGGWWTTRELRELEQHALDTARDRTAEPTVVGVAFEHRGGRDVGLEAAAERRGHIAQRRADPCALEIDHRPGWRHGACR